MVTDPVRLKARETTMYARKSKTPQYVVIYEEILRNILNGVWQIGSQLPTEGQLQEDYQVSRGTVRQAMAALEEEGYIERRSGKGTFVMRTKPRMKKKLAEILPFSEQLRQAGYSPTTDIASVNRVQVADIQGTRVAEGFGLEETDEVNQIRRIRKGDDTPFAIQTVYLRTELTPPIEEQNLFNLMDMYARVYHRRIVEADEVIRLATATEEEAHLLAVAPGTAVVVRDRVSFDETGEVFEVLHSVDRGDLLKYQYRIISDFTDVSNSSAGE